ncbi:hypothetical protein MUK42_29014 [Musa troglodytarum]|uniref:Uncharacterized protein n=1 Tax=Musa troglodytarum TaxID=320322 RepID=A0A9E7FLD2_9LILI|nr:hypothetical protein MUK42_29014 [Musa troglodytarum]
MYVRTTFHVRQSWFHANIIHISFASYIYCHKCSYPKNRLYYSCSYRVILVRALPRIVARRFVVADDEDGAAVAAHTAAADGRGRTPHYLGVVAAHLVRGARVAVVVVVLLLGDPGVDGVRRRVVAAGAPEDVLAVRPAGVHELAVGRPLVGVVLGVRRDGVVPRHGADADGGPGGVVGAHEVLGRVLG